MVALHNRRSGARTQVKRSMVMSSTVKTSAKPQDTLLLNGIQGTALIFWYRVCSPDPSKTFLSTFLDPMFQYLKRNISLT